MNFRNLAGHSVTLNRLSLRVFNLRTHRGVLKFPSAVQDYISRAISLGRIVGPFDAPPFPDSFVVSPLNTVAKRDSGTKSDR